MLPNSASASSPKAAVAAPPVPQQLVLGSQAVEVGFPWAGAGLLLLLALLAIAARWYGRAGDRPSRAAAWLERFRASHASAPPPSTLSVVSSVKLDAGAQLHVVSWQDRKWLVATHARGGTSLIDRLPAEPATSRGVAG